MDKLNTIMILTDTIYQFSIEFINYAIDFHYKNNYDKVILVGNKETINLKHKVNHQFYKIYGEELDMDVLVLNNLENIDYIFERLNYKIKEVLDSNILINYTNGSNKLSAVAIIIARMYGLKIQNMNGLEDLNKIVNFNIMEKDNNASTPLYYVKYAFNSYNFKVSLNLLNQNYTDFNNIANYFVNLITFYDKWDEFVYEPISSEDEILNFFTNLYGLESNIRAVEILSDKENNLYSQYKVADLISNAYRRIEEERFGDAIIRLYRALELISELELFEKFNIRKTDVRINELKNLDIESTALEKIINRLDFKYPKYNIPLTTSFFLLQKLYDDVGVHYFKNKDKYQELFQRRNISVLVHGDYIYTKEEIEEMYDLVVSMALVYDSNINQYIKETQFPKFKL